VVRPFLPYTTTAELVAGVQMIGRVEARRRRLGIGHLSSGRPRIGATATGAVDPCSPASAAQSTMTWDRSERPRIGRILKGYRPIKGFMVTNMTAAWRGSHSGFANRMRINQAAT